ncbi:putative calmodulin binding protein [Tripterygium wilfordii]|uniref:Putative calmodulin binding protein n=1 Tax=Tripterygium wilfordii TaxID=458696 RepID=A0A7J7CTU4_TRIWF|nr:auxin-responsive protein SAUR71-like [Tripterygium wilfordii]KAF5737532.1 putative calmodulin binding protein [Tripterygium wilfordii]
MFFLIQWAKRGAKIVRSVNSTKMKNREESIRSLVMLKLFIRKLQRVLVHLASREHDLDEEMDARIMIPEDVKEGHFAVVAVNGGEPKRFVVELGNLSNPQFLRLLEQAREEYGFCQTGVLALPCQPEELQRILKQKRRMVRSI